MRRTAFVRTALAALLIGFIDLESLLPEPEPEWMFVDGQTQKVGDRFERGFYIEAIDYENNTITIGNREYDRKLAGLIE